MNVNREMFGNALLAASISAGIVGGYAFAEMQALTEQEIAQQDIAAAEAWRAAGVDPHQDPNQRQSLPVQPRPDSFKYAVIEQKKADVAKESASQAMKIWLTLGGAVVGVAIGMTARRFVCEPEEDANLDDPQLVTAP